MRTTVVISDLVLQETQALYGSENRSNAIENALRDAIRFRKIQMLIALKHHIDFDDEALQMAREVEIDENNG